MKNLTALFFLFVFIPVSFAQTIPVITTQPQSKTVSLGETAEFTVDANCSDPIGYQWWKSPFGENDYLVDEEAKVSGATGSILKLYNVTSDLDGTQYICEVYNATLRENGITNNWINSDAVELTVNKIGLKLDWGNKTFVVGSTQKITWETQGIENINLEYSINDGQNWKKIVENYQAGIGNYDWIVPNTLSIYCKIKISDSKNPMINSIHPINAEFSQFGSANVHFTIYGENKWETIFNTNKTITKIKFVDDQSGIAWGNNTLFVTNDGGESWQLKSEYIGGATSFIDENHGWKITHSDFADSILKTIDGGKSWTTQFQWLSSNEPRIYNIFFLDQNYGWVSGGLNRGSGDKNTLVFRTINGGMNWEMTFNFNHELIGPGRQIEFISPSRGWMFSSSCSWYCNKIILQSNDGGYNFNGGGSGDILAYDLNKNGTSWTSISVGTPVIPIPEGKLFGGTDQISISSYEQYITEIYFYDDRIGWCFGETNKNSSSYNFISSTIDGGKTWIIQNFAPSANFKSIIDFFSPDGETCWAINVDGDILKYGTSFATPGIWSRDILITDNSNTTLNPTFGQANTATADIDDQLGESELPPPPPNGTFDARFILENNSSTILDLRNSDETEIVWKLQFQPSSSGYPIIFSWDNQNLPFGSFFLQDVITGKIINVDMKLSNSFILTNESINKLKIVYNEEFTNTVSYNKNWDLVSVPLKTESNEVKSIFKDYSSNAFFFDGSYKNTINLENGKGYWLKFNENTTLNIYGDKILDPIQVKKGWNLIGGYNDEIQVSSLTSNPSGIITSNIYGFNNGYHIADKLIPGDGYWIKSSQDGELNVGSNNTLSKKISNNKVLTEPFLTIPIKVDDGISDSIMLFVGIDSLATNSLDTELGEEELPPLPPIGVFDIRLTLPDTTLTTYSDYRHSEIGCNEHIINYQLGDSSSGLKLSWNLPEGVTLSITDLFGGSIFNENFESGEGIYKIANININNAKLTLCYSDKIFTDIKSESIPTEYNLSQNYPNPFNPSTVIKYSIPSNIVTHGHASVQLIIYDILGREVTKLVNQEQIPGNYEVIFNANNLSSGIYYYQIKTGNFTKAMKMVLLK